MAKSIKLFCQIVTAESDIRGGVDEGVIAPPSEIELFSRLSTGSWHHLHESKGASRASDVMHEQAF